MKTDRNPADLLGDAGVLDEAPVFEVFGWTAVRRVGGLALLPLRGDWKAALAAGVDAVPREAKVGARFFQQAVVHLQKGRAATEAGLAAAWKRLGNGGKLLLVGGNDLGIKSAVKRLAAELEQEADVVANRARARVACFEKSDDRELESPMPNELTVECGGESFVVGCPAGVFSGDAVDTGSQIVLEHLGTLDPPRGVLDMGCGAGILGLAALRRWTQATAVLADHDGRAVDAAKANAESLGVADRCRVAWWDATTERAPVDRCDLILLNPPFHTGKAVDLAPARAMFRAADEVLEHGGTMLVVANRSLPYERELEKAGRLRKVRERAGFKLLEVTR